MVGYFMGTNSRSRHQRQLVTDADVLLLVGNRANRNGTDSWSFYPLDATYIQIDIDGDEIGRNYEAKVRLLGDAKLAPEALTKEMSARDLKKRMGARKKLEAAIATGRKSTRLKARRFAHRTVGLSGRSGLCRSWVLELVRTISS